MGCSRGQRGFVCILGLTQVLQPSGPQGAATSSLKQSRGDPREPLSPHSPTRPQLLVPGGRLTRCSPFSARVFDFSFLWAMWGCVSSCRELWVSFLGLLSKLLELLCLFPNPLIYPLWPAEFRAPGLSRAHSQSPVLVENSGFLITDLFNIQHLGRNQLLSQLLGSRVTFQNKTVAFCCRKQADVSA